LPDSALLKKLQLKPGLSGAVINAPDGYLERIGPLANKLRPNLDFVQLFVRDKAQLERLAPAAVESVKPDGLLWIAYLKGGKKAGTDLNRDLVRDALPAREQAPYLTSKGADLATSESNSTFSWYLPAGQS
jgi:hypothetical protein